MKQLTFPVEIEEEEVEATFIESTIENDVPVMEDVEEEPYVEVVSVVLTRHKVVNVTGKVTGRVYTFRGAGSIRDDVDIRDAELMVNTPLTKSCCGSYSTPQFQILGR